MPQKPNTKPNKPMIFSLVFAACFNEGRAYPFGMGLIGRQKLPANYRYGFNSQEKETEITDSPTHYFAEFWMYDSRLGRRWEIDPVIKPWQSNYATFSNSPIWRIDPSGDDDYGLDENTGRLSLTKRRTEDETDNISIGSYDENGVFSAKKDAATHSAPKGILNALVSCQFYNVANNLYLCLQKKKL